MGRVARGDKAILPIAIRELAPAHEHDDEVTSVGIHLEVAVVARF